MRNVEFIIKCQMDIRGSAITLQGQLELLIHVLEEIVQIDGQS
jgi:hypothetical protein